MLPTFIDTVTVAGKALICHYHPVPNERAYVVQILNHVRCNTKFSLQCNAEGVWHITSECADSLVEAQALFVAAIEKRLGNEQATYICGS